MDATSDRWVPVTVRESLSDPIDFVLTPRERDLAQVASLYLEARRRDLNTREALRGTHERT